ncbi:MAG: protein kinase [Candidatus Eisenbacteria bacterium]
MIGRTISHYRVLEKLGEGGMGVVYRAEDTKLGRTVALKFLPPELTKDPEAKRRFVHEAQAASALDHPNICTIHEIDAVEGLTFISMACIEGESLKKKIGAGPLPIDEAIGVAIQVAEGLQEAHEKGIVHRDIKPDNVMVTPKGQAKIMDFGLARSAGKTTLTKEGTTLGTVAYMSPEQARGEAVDHRTDIWSLGVVLYEMVTGRLPFRGDHEPAVIYSILNEDPEPPTAVRTGVPMELERIVGKCLSKEGGGRYQHADELLVDLRVLGRGSERAAPVPRPEKRERSRLRVVLIPAAVVLVVAAGLVSWYFGPSRESTVSERKMLVVLPFKNLGSPDDEYFSDGITEEITSRLASLHGLGVISRTSATKYKDTEKTLKQIGDELNVDFALEGTIRWEKAGDVNRVRITPQLIRVSDDTHLWSNCYERPLTGVFEVQADIAGKVTEALNITLLEPERRSLESRPTDNLDAYQAYLRGLDLSKRREWKEEDVRLAVRMFERAVELDPGFALAYAELAMVHIALHRVLWDYTKERLELAKEAADKALSIDPRLPEGHLALGCYYYWGYTDHERALEALSVAREDRPNDTRVLLAIAEVWHGQGKFEEALDLLQKALQLNPRDPDQALQVAWALELAGRPREAIPYFDCAISLAPDMELAYADKARNYLDYQGDIAEARKIVEGLPSRSHLASVYALFFVELYDRNYRAALDALASPLTESTLSPFYTSWTAVWRGFALELLNEPDRARSAYEEAKARLEERVIEQPGDFFSHAVLGLAYAGLGRKEDAIREAMRGTKLHPVSKDVAYGPLLVEDLAWVYVMVGEYERALDEIEYLLTTPQLTVWELRFSPQWDPLRGHPRFKALIEEGSERAL